jgi:hypothetical protein
MGKSTTKRGGGKPLLALTSRLASCSKPEHGDGQEGTRDEMMQVRSTGFSRKAEARPPRTTNGAFPTAWRINTFTDAPAFGQAVAMDLMYLAKYQARTVLPVLIVIRALVDASETVSLAAVPVRFAVSVA